LSIPAIGEVQKPYR